MYIIFIYIIIIPGVYNIPWPYCVSIPAKWMPGIWHGFKLYRVRCSYRSEVTRSSTSSPSWQREMSLHRSCFNQYLVTYSCWWFLRIVTLLKEGGPNSTLWCKRSKADSAITTKWVFRSNLLLWLHQVCYSNMVYAAQTNMLVILTITELLL